MSFLLDALGKADHDRRRSEVPELKTYNPGGRSSLRGGIRVLIWLVLMAFTFSLGYFARPYLETTFFSYRVADTSKTSAQMLAKPVGKAASTATDQAGGAENVARNSNRSDYGLEVISYSDSPPARFVMINGTMLHEGDRLGTGEILLTIGPDAVVLDKAGTQIRLEM